MSIRDIWGRWSVSRGEMNFLFHFSMVRIDLLKFRWITAAYFDHPTYLCKSRNRLPFETILWSFYLLFNYDVITKVIGSFQAILGSWVRDKSVKFQMTTFGHRNSPLFKENSRYFGKYYLAKIICREISSVLHICSFIFNHRRNTTNLRDIYVKARAKKGVWKMSSIR